MKETSKSITRRLQNSQFAVRWFIGQGLDIGAGADPLGQYRELFPGIKGVRPWNAADGDAQYLAGIADNSFEFVHAAMALQRVADPREALKHWFRVLKPGGHLVLTVPDEDLYEQGTFPSQFNPEHHWTFTVFKAKSWSPNSINVTDLVQALGAQAEVKKIELLDATYRYGLPRFDQTLTPVAECAIEVVLRKRPLDESVAGGRLPREGGMSAQDVLVLTGLKVQQ